MAKRNRDLKGQDTKPPRFRQIGALPYRLEDGDLKLLLVTSRGTSRPIVPKGWPMKGLGDRKAAQIEACEEAGVQGRVWKRPFGSYEYWKRLKSVFVMTEVDVFPIEVRSITDEYKEFGQRKRFWLSPAEASRAVHEPSLSSLILQFGNADLR